MVVVIVVRCEGAGGGWGFNRHSCVHSGTVGHIVNTLGHNVYTMGHSALMTPSGGGARRRPRNTDINKHLTKPSYKLRQLDSVDACF